MHIRCPHCHNPVEVVDADPLTDVTCPSCGSNFSLISGETTSYTPGDVRTIGHFHLLESVGAGRFGTVWKARDTKLDRIVAVKIPRRGQIEGPEAEMFIREARAAAQVKHPGVVAVHEVGREDNTLYIVSDFIDGCSLKDWLSGRQLTPREAAELCAKIAEALHVAHEAGVVHRDLKPGNVMMDMAGQPRLTDFGLAKREAGEITMTVDGQMLGTPAYMSPEQARGEAHTADRRSDVYSLGVIFFELLTGETPFRGNQRMMVVQILQDDPPSPRKLQTRIPRDLETICLKCLEKAPGKRYQTAAELAEELGRYLRGEPIVARPIGRPARLWRWCKRQPVVAALIAAVALTLVAGTLVSSIFAVRAYAERDRADGNAKRADQKAEEADGNAKRADGKAIEALEEKRKTQRQLALYYIDRGVNELENGDPWRGFAILGQAYRATDDAPDLRLSVRSLLGAWDKAFPCMLKHDGWVEAVAFSPDGTKIATASEDHTARLWDAATGKPLGEPLGHDGPVRSVAFSQDGTKIATVSGKTARLWDAATRKPLGEPLKHNDNVNSVAFGPDGTKIATVSNNRKEGEVRLWDVATCKPLGGPLKHDGAMSVVAFSPDGTKIATASKDKTARLWDVATRKPLGEPLKHDDNVNSVAFSPDGTKIATASHGPPLKESTLGLTWVEGEARLWDVATCKPLGEPLKQAGAVDAVAFSPDGTKIATASQWGRFARLWDVATGKLLGEPLMHDGAVMAVVFSADGTKVATASDDKTARLWDAATGKPLGKPLKHDGRVRAVAFSLDGTKIATASTDGTARIWDAAAGKPLGKPIEQIETGPVEAVAFSADGTKVVTVSTSTVGEGGKYVQGLWELAEGSLWRERIMHSGLDSVPFMADAEIPDVSGRTTTRLWDVATGKPVGEAKCDSWANNMLFSPDGTKIATASRDKTARLWDAATGKPLGEPLKHDDWLSGVVFSADSTKIATASDDGTARLWDAATGKPLCEPLKHHDWGVSHVRFSPDGTKIATVSRDLDGTKGEVRLWDARTGKPLGEPHKYDGFASDSLFSPDGTKVALVSWKSVWFWDVATGRPHGEPLKHDDWVSGVVFSADSTKIATASDDGTARLWDAATGKPLGEPLGHDGPVRSVAFSQDGTKIATGSWDGARLWDVPRSIPDNRAWVAAYVETVSGLSEDADHSLHPLSNDEAVSSWREVLKSPGWLEQRTASLDRSRYALHITEADEQEAAKNWFAAAFHLRWLVKLEPNNPEWPQRLAKAKEHLASPANVAPEPRKGSKKKPDAPKATDTAKPEAPKPVTPKSD